MVKIRQNFCRDFITDIPKVVRKELDKRRLLLRIGQGDRIAIAAGSREISNIQIILRELIRAIKSRGAKPFIVPAMGSHGGATAQGQTEVLNSLGITEESVEAPIRATMDVVHIGTTTSGLPGNIDRYAHEADGIIVVGRIKQHTSFRAPLESGLAKMIAVGLGKREGAEIAHAAGISEVPRRVMELAETTLAKEKILFGVGILENAYDETYQISTIPAERIMTEEPVLLDISREHMPQILFEQCDVLIVDEAGKNISGTGMDTNVIRRHYVDTVKMKPLAQRIVVLDLTGQSHGNANGMTNADVCTERFFNKIDFSETYPNPLTNGMLESCKIPVIMKSDKIAIQAAIKGCFKIDLNNARVIRIKNTLKVGEILISENLLADARANESIDIIGEPENLYFDEHGNLQS
jgi:hypothetical protein